MPWVLDVRIVKGFSSVVKACTSCKNWVQTQVLTSNTLDWNVFQMQWKSKFLPNSLLCDGGEDDPASQMWKAKFPFSSSARIGSKKLT